MISYFSDLRYKEVIDVHTGYRLGYICDAEFDDAEDVVVVQSIDGEYLIHELAVARNNTGLQPLQQAPVGDFEPQRKQTAVFLRFFHLLCVAPQAHQYYRYLLKQ